MQVLVELQSHNEQRLLLITIDQLPASHQCSQNTIQNL